MDNNYYTRIEKILMIDGNKFLDLPCKSVFKKQKKKRKRINSNINVNTTFRLFSAIFKTQTHTKVKWIQRLFGLSYLEFS